MVNIDNMIELQESQLVPAIQAAFKLSHPFGLGFLHYNQSDELSIDDASNMIDINDEVPISLDYVKGRAVKFTVFKMDNKFYISNNWFDHNQMQLNELLRMIAI